MKLLAFDTSTELISIAVTRLVNGQARVWQHTGTGGAQASSALIPAIEVLMAEADLRYEELDAIAFGQGPGSFTGLRTACAVAQGLGFGVGVPLLPVDTLLAVAEEARQQYALQQSALRVLALLDARMDELYAAHYAYAGGVWQQREDYGLFKPEQLALQDSTVLAGNVFVEYGERLPVQPALPRWQALPTAAAMLRLAPALLAAGHAVPAEQALPRYIRDKVAKTTLERAAEKAAAH
ncbi:MAG: tRNA (adenosine(37)-N6)-threonylcarbamoyltransferase complex dimerization subunit type 1 TsaB [Curvibacter sp. GWA2_64_110]|nr:MAG: tRNA (adenosine(37)-N6)-threonylcarbamoyltransferase complex dimerization subunit type 1 TsaB [Curvibacter sp. GWA2_64_110]HCY16115.1 tRNA (adenosine(37)-N6)-threonylcarbamoyltransferase complex dimerization subunit type 1 TsaB [Curvibacter sp.]